jgi:hypothetical protein
VIEEMIALAKDMQRANERGATLKLNEEELAFFTMLSKPTTAAPCKFSATKLYELSRAR